MNKCKSILKISKLFLDNDPFAKQAQGSKQKQNNQQVECETQIIGSLN